jgi:hypothetical protein
MSNPILLLAFTTFFHFVFDCSKAVSVSEDMCWVSFTVVFQVSGVLCQFHLILTDLMNRSGGPEEAHNETSRRDQLTLNAMLMALLVMLLDKARDFS